MHAITNVLCVTLAAAMLTACGAGSGRGWEGPPPNLVIVALDTLRPDHLGLYGYEKDTSPNLDVFARDCIVFENAQSTSPWTAPLLTSLMTSLYPQVHQVQAFPNPGRMSENVTTLAEVLDQNGFATAAFTEGGYAKGAFGLDQGFDVYPKNPGDDETHSSNRGHPSRIKGNVDRALEWLGEHHGEPFFLFFHTYEPHSPYRAPVEHVRRLSPHYDEETEHASAGRVIEAWNRARQLTRDEAMLLSRHWFHCELEGLPTIRHVGELCEVTSEHGVGLKDCIGEPELLAWVRDLYDAEISFMDEQMARLWEALERRGLLQRTIVVVVSDHGEGLGEHGRMEHGYQLYEELLRIVLLVRAPHAFLEPGRVHELVRSIDVMPTVLDLMGIATDDLLLQGRSLVGAMQGRTGELPSFSHGRSVPAGEDTLYSVRLGRWRLIVDELTGESWLYDLQTDADEEHDVKQVHADIAARLRKMVQSQASEDAALRERISTRVSAIELDDATRNDLSRLGYVGGADEGFEND